MFGHGGHLRIKCYVRVLLSFLLLISSVSGRAYDFRDAIDDFVASPKHKDLRPYELSASDWSAISLVKEWLRSFRDAVLDMSTTKRVTLSYVHAVFKGLQEHIKASLAALPNTASPGLRQGLVNAHRKLSDYYYKFDESPYYVWAASKSLWMSFCGTNGPQF
jgi:hypothetical protein